MYTSTDAFVVPAGELRNEILVNGSLPQNGHGFNSVTIFDPFFQPNANHKTQKNIPSDSKKISHHLHPLIFIHATATIKATVSPIRTVATPCQNESKIPSMLFFSLYRLLF
jgi:hypothetical protein